jgi:Zn ribbon nucleic-acid-binding protein
MDIFTLLFLIIVLAGSFIVYHFYLKEKSSELDTIRRGFCPRCHQKDTIEITDERSSGCCSPKQVTFECVECKYTNNFSIESGCRL